MRYNFTFLIVVILIITASCRKDFSAVLSSGNLSFSKDTVFLDTVFSNIGSSTYNLKVYNKHNQTIAIPSIKLEDGENSNYRLNIDGIPGKTFEDVKILAKDSIYIFIETTINYNEVTNPIYQNKIVFDTGENLQEVSIITLVKDAHFLFPSKNAEGLIETITTGIDASGKALKINGFYLNNNTTFTNEKPYVIYGYCAVPENKTLTIEAGTNIHFHSNSGIIIDRNATLIVEGDINNPVIFEGDRLEPQFSDIPGQWGTIWLRAGSKNSSINNAIIKNATAGIISDSISSNSPTLTIKNTQIYNSTNFGILGRETNIKGENLVINNSGQASLACIIGGTYNFTHGSFTNFWNGSLRQYPSVLINNYFTYNNNGEQIIETRDLQAANFTNCIIDGNSNIELVLDKVDGSVFNYSFQNNLIKFNDYNQSYKGIVEFNFEDTNHYQNNIFNGNPDFKSAINNELIIGENSDAIQKASLQGTNMAPYDILGILRTSPADIGAYQHIILD
ncbi:MULTISPECIES: hypothetical protein [Flavobacteriaceae]|uniref:Right-handed parallel beta-helix repeat-containing protein n=2 Tax=Flavobacteriaceae TaxID=49546 RepID=A0A4Y8AQR5_9FLAO|nr:MULTISPECIES: hypothetical protein [Flavobacteriaceae]TEW72168.1 hypothetical protein E2488_14990 [Gramella jeungdoensis]GGK56933.1 hypothetical protein GCM10007963_26440 [Lutibacter litoralis]